MQGSGNVDRGSNRNIGKNLDKIQENIDAGNKALERKVDQGKGANQRVQRGESSFSNPNAKPLTGREAENNPKGPPVHSKRVVIIKKQEEKTLGKAQEKLKDLDADKMGNIGRATQAFSRSSKGKGEGKGGSAVELEKSSASFAEAAKNLKEKTQKENDQLDEAIQSYKNILRPFKSSRIAKFTQRKNGITFRMQDAEKSINKYQGHIDNYKPNDAKQAKELNDLENKIKKQLTDINNEIVLTSQDKDYQKGGIAKLWTWLRTPKGQKPDYQYEEVKVMQKELENNSKSLQEVYKNLQDLRTEKQMAYQSPSNKDQGKINKLAQEAKTKLDQIGSRFKSIFTNKTDQ